jgi:hypothetical protein
MKPEKYSCYDCEFSSGCAPFYNCEKYGFRDMVRDEVTALAKRCNPKYKEGMEHE